MQRVDQGSSDPAGRDRYVPPAEKVAKLAAAFLGSLKSLLHSLVAGGAIRPHGRAVQLKGGPPPAGVSIRFPKILVVDDTLEIAQLMTQVIRQHYIFGRITVFEAYGFKAAASFFSNEDIRLVIMDFDLGDELGDGIHLVRKFLQERPETIILANSNSAISNRKLTTAGAVEITGKDPGKLLAWLRQHDSLQPDGQG